MTALQTSEVELDKMTLEEAVAHYGVKGMKWGVRRPVGPNGLVKKTSAKKGPSDQGKESSDGKAGGTASQGRKVVAKRSSLEGEARKLSQTELKLAVERLRLEKEYANLNRELNPEKVPMQRKLLKASGKIAKEVAIEVTKQAAKEIVVGAVRKKTGLELGGKKK